MNASVRGLSATGLKADAVSLLVHRCETASPGAGDGVGVGVAVGVGDGAGGGVGIGVGEGVDVVAGVGVGGAPTAVTTSRWSLRLHFELVRSFVYASVSVWPPAGSGVVAL